MPSTDRLSLLSAAFRDQPLTLGPIKLRPVTAGTYQLLADLGNPMAVLSPSASPAAEADFFTAVIQFAWVHSAPLEEVIRVQAAEDIPAASLRELAFSVTVPDVMEFLVRYKDSSLRTAAAMAEVMDDEEEGAEGKPIPAIRPSGSPASSSASELQETPPERDTCSGPPPSPELSSISTPLPPLMVVDADGSIRSADPAEVPPDMPATSVPDLQTSSAPGRQD